MAPLVALLTDFGLDDPYVGQMKAALLGKAPGTELVDISHGVRPQDVLQASFFLSASFPHLPGNSLCLCVVDPGVGTKRKIVLLQQGQQRVLAPDNGLLTLVLERGQAFRAWDMTASQPPGPVSATFHGRDLFAPLAADLILGKDPDTIGMAIAVSSLHRLRLPRVTLQRDTLTAVVLHVDRFGNCVLNVPDGWAARLRTYAWLRLEKPVDRSVALATTYGRLAQGQLGLLPGSQGYYELALNGSSAAADLGLAPGAGCVFECRSDFPRDSHP
ncbi:MAG: SAM hydrolase/SAM-dependent halogenase family protein [Desulfohalobiaceae bacterium]